MVIGNLIIGERYAEPQGPSRIVNETTGDYCDMDFKVRGAWSTKTEDLQYVSGEVKTKNGETKYSFGGKYLDKVYATSIETGNKFVIFEQRKFPKGPQDSKKIYGMNLYSLQMNSISD